MEKSTSNYYYIMTFQTTKDAIAGEAYAKEHIRTAIMPLPMEISSGCGLALRFPYSTLKEILTFCEAFPLSFKLYRMDIKRINGIRNVEKLLESTL